MRLGIDFGTWYTSAVLYRGEGQPLATIKDPGFHGASIPSCLYLQNNGGWLFGSSAWNSRHHNPNRFLHSELKNNLLMHGGPEPLLIGDAYCPLDELIGRLLGWIKQEADRIAHSWGEAPLERVTLTVPVDYAPARRDVMRKAAHRAGFKDIELVDEPVAAALSVLKQGKIQTGETVLIYDLGGGTFDAALVKQTGDRFDVLAKDGLPQCGGVHFDHAIYRWLTDHASQRQTDLTPLFDRNNKHPQAQQVRLMTLDNCREAKHQLSAIPSADIQVPAGDYASYPFNRPDLEAMLTDSLEQTLTASRRVLSDAGIKPADLDHIVMVGGSSRIPAVAALLKRAFGKEPVLAADPELAIAEGAALRQNAKANYKSTKPINDLPEFKSLSIAECLTILAIDEKGSGWIRIYNYLGVAIIADLAVNNLIHFDGMTVKTPKSVETQNKLLSWGISKIGNGVNTSSLDAVSKMNWLELSKKFQETLVSKNICAMQEGRFLFVFKTDDYVLKDLAVKKSIQQFLVDLIVNERNVSERSAILMAIIVGCRLEQLIPLNTDLIKQHQQKLNSISTTTPLSSAVLTLGQIVWEKEQAKRDRSSGGGGGCGGGCGGG